MKPFSFRLQALDALRKAERDARRADFAAALTEQARLAQCRQTLAEQLAAAEQQTREARIAGQLTIETLIRGQHFESSLRGEVESLIGLQAAAEAVTARTRESLAIAEREVQVLEKLHERQLAEHRLEHTRAETRQLDEVAAERFQREAA